MKRDALLIATPGGGDARGVEAVLGDFAGAGVKATHVDYGPEPGYWEKVREMHASRQLADVLWSSSGNLQAVAYRHVTAELDPLVRDDGYALEDFLPNAVEAVKFNGRLHALPWGGDPGMAGVLYNVDLLRQAGLDVTEDCASFDGVSWDALRDAARQAARDDRFGIAPANGLAGLTNWTGSYGGEFLVPDGRKLALRGPDFFKGLSLLWDVVATDHSAPTDGADPLDLFAAGRLAMAQVGYDAQRAPALAPIGGRFKWGIGLTPRGPAGKRGTALNVLGQSIWARSGERDAAWQLLRFLLDPANAVKATLAGARPAMRPSVLDDPRLSAGLPAHACFAPLIKSAEGPKVPWNFRAAELDDEVHQSFANLLQGKQEPDWALAYGVPRLQAVLDKPLP